MKYSNPNSDTNLTSSPDDIKKQIASIHENQCKNCPKGALGESCKECYNFRMLRQYSLHLLTYVKE